MVVAYFDTVGNLAEVVQDLQLVQFDDGSWGYEGFNPLWTSDGTPADYSPDTLTIFLATDGLWYINQVCNDLYGCIFVDP
jgi:hypothetical protein